MSGNIQKIPSNAISQAPLGKTLRKFHQGNDKLVEYVRRWTSRSAEGRLTSLSQQWNQTVVNLLGGLEKLYKLYSIDLERSFDGKKIFTDHNDTSYWNTVFDRPSLIEEEIFNLFLERASLNDSYETTNSQITAIKNFTVPDTFLDLKDTPSSYSGQSLKYLGVDHSGTSLSFLYPKSQVTLLQLSDGPASYPNDQSVIRSGVAALETVQISESKNWKLQEISNTAPITAYTFSGTACDNVLYSVDVGATAANTSFQISLGTTFDGARIAFKCTNGVQYLSEKYIQGSSPVNLMDGAIGNYLLEPPFALTFVYSTTTESYYLTEKFEAF